LDEPVRTNDSAAAADRPIALTDEDGCHVGAGQLVRIRVVDHDLAIARQRGRSRGGIDADRAGELDGAVFVGILQARIDEDWRRGAVETLLQIFFGDARNRHDSVL